MKYKVQHLEDSIYQVLVTGYEREYDNIGLFKADHRYENEAMFQGTIMECWVWIILKENGQI